MVHCWSHIRIQYEPGHARRRLGAEMFLFKKRPLFVRINRILTAVFAAAAALFLFHDGSDPSSVGCTFSELRRIGSPGIRNQFQM